MAKKRTGGQRPETDKAAVSPSVPPKTLILDSPFPESMPSAGTVSFSSGTIDPSRLPVVMATIRTASDHTPLTREEQAILDVLQKKHPTLVTQEDLAGGTDITDRTVRKCLKYLSSKGLVCQPRGTKKGYGLTEAGRSILRR